MRLSGSSGIAGCWLLRAVRGARLDRNPLRRGIDRLETGLLAGLLVAVAAGTPFAAGLASHASYLSALQARQEQLATSHQVRAVLTSDATSVGGYSVSAYVLTPASWTSVTGARRSGVVPAEQGSRKGTAVTVWTDSRGDLEGPPLPVSEVAGQADAAAVGVVAGAILCCIVGAGAIRQLANRRRMAAWEADWLATAQTWNRQRW
jgi:hypothetical protein